MHLKRSAHREGANDPAASHFALCIVFCQLGHEKVYVRDTTIGEHGKETRTASIKTNSLRIYYCYLFQDLLRKTGAHRF